MLNGEYVCEFRNGELYNYPLKEIIRCEDCVYCADPVTVGWCAYIGRYTDTENGFCAWGVRRDG